MAETTALVVGLVMPALHIIRLLAEDIKKIIDAPKIIQDLRDKLDAIHASVECLKDITEEQWAALGQKVSDQSKATIEACIKTCRDLDGRIRNWTKSQNGQLSWRRKAVIGLFKEHRIKAEADQLLACKASLDATVNMATLFSSLQTRTEFTEIKQMLSEREADFTTVANNTDNQIATVERSLVRLRVDGQEQQHDEMDEDDLEDHLEDLGNAEQAINEELTMLRASQNLIQELMSQLKKKEEEANEEAKKQEGSQTTVSFGDHTVNSGLLVGNNAGHLNFTGGVSFGNPNKESRNDETPQRQQG